MIEGNDWFWSLKAVVHFFQCSCRVCSLYSNLVCVGKETGQKAHFVLCPSLFVFIGVDCVEPGPAPPAAPAAVSQ